MSETTPLLAAPGPLPAVQPGDFADFIRRATFEAPALIGSTAASLVPELPQEERVALPGHLSPYLRPLLPTAHGWPGRGWSAWLHASAAVHRVDVGNAVSWAQHQPTPSARCLYPARVSLLTCETPGPDGLNAGVYRYDSRHHALIPCTGSGLQRRPLDLLREQLSSPLSGVFGGAAVSIDWGRTHAKYGQFSYRLALLEAGMQAAQLAVVAEALGGHATLLWDFPDGPVNLTLGVGRHERAVALVLLRHEPGTVQTPRYQTPNQHNPAPELEPHVRTPAAAELGALDCCTHLHSSQEPAPTGPGLPAQVTPLALGRRDLLRTIRSRHSGDPVFAPLAEDCGDSRLNSLLRSAAQPYPLSNGARIPAVALHAVYRDGGNLRHLRAAPGMADQVCPVSASDLSEVQPDLPLVHAPLTVWFCATLPDASRAREYRRLNLEVGVMAQRLLLLAAEFGWAGRASCSYHASKAQAALGLPPDEAPLLQLTFGREPPSPLGTWPLPTPAAALKPQAPSWTADAHRPATAQSSPRRSPMITTPALHPEVQAIPVESPIATGRPSPVPDPVPTGLPPPFTLRVTGLPTAALAALQSPLTLEAARSVLQRQADLEQCESALADGLHGLIGHEPDPARRRELLKLKRRAAQSGWTTAVVGALVGLAPELAGELEAHVGALLARQDAAASGETAAETESAAATDRLRHWTDTDQMRAALLLSSPTLLADAERFWRGEPLSSKTRRQVQASLTAYLLRAATKPSPFNRYTSVCTGTWSEQAQPLVTRHGWAPQVRSELNLQVGAALTAAPGRQTAPDTTLLVELNATLMQSSTQYVYVSRKGPVVRVRRTPDLDRLVSALSPGPLSVSALLDHYELQAGPDRSESVTALWRHLQRLQGVGLLDLTPPVGWTSEWHAELDTLTSAFQTAKVAERPERLEQLNRRTHDAYMALGLARFGLEPPARNLVFEDSGAADLRPSASPAHWQPILNDLALVQRAFSLADGTLPARQAFASWFCARYGAGTFVPALQVYQDVLEAGHPWATAAGGFHWPAGTCGEVTTVARTVQQLLMGDEAGQVDTGTLSLALADLPADVFTPSYAFYGQLHGPTSAPGFVLNAAQLGFGRPAGRARWIMNWAAGPPVTSRPLLDLAGDLHANINRHACPKTLSVVHTSGHVSPAELPLTDLLFTVTAEGARPDLWSSRLGKAVWAVPLGLLGELYLSPIFRFLSAMTVGGPLDPGLPELRTLPLPGRPQPRLSLGRVVLQRARWLVPDGGTGRFTGHSTFQTVLDREAARQAQSMPAQVFARADLGEHWSKPVLVDFHSPLSWTALPRSAPGGEGLLLEEALPNPLAPQDQRRQTSPGLVISAAGEHVTEFVLEVAHA